MSNEDAPQQDGQVGEQTQTSARQQQGERGGSNRHGGGGGRNNRRFQNQPHREGFAPQQIGQAVNMEELRELVELIAAHGFTDFELEREGFRVRLRRGLTSSDTSVQTSVGASSIAQNTTASVASAPASSAQPSVASSSPPPATSGSSEKVESKPTTDQDLHTITSPIVGTFYRAPSPTAEPFVRAGSAVEADSIVCIIEAMKLMNEIQAETSGVIEKIYVENAQPVEYGQPLFGVRK